MPSLLLLDEDLGIAARTVYGEARGEPYEGKKAVAHVLINRWHSTEGQFARDDTLATACLRHLQFSAWNYTDPNFPAMFATNLMVASFRECMRAVLEALDEADPTRGSLHYHTKQKPGGNMEWPPAWTRGHAPAAEIGSHVFYNDIN